MKDQLKIESTLKIEWSQHISHYKSMGIFPDAQGQLTSQSGPIRDFMVVFLPERMKKIQSNMKALEWSQHYSFIFQTLKGS